MQAKYRNAYNALKKLGVPVFTNADHEDRGNFGISAEEPESFEFVNYYSMASDWVFGVSPVVENALRKYGLFAEWQNPGALSVHEA